MKFSRGEVQFVITTRVKGNVYGWEGGVVIKTKVSKIQILIMKDMSLGDRLFLIVRRKWYPIVNCNFNQSIDHLSIEILVDVVSNTRFTRCLATGCYIVAHALRTVIQILRLECYLTTRLMTALCLLMGLTSEFFTFGKINFIYSWKCPTSV